MGNAAQRRQSTLGSWAGTIVRALDAHGHDGAALCLRVGIEPDVLRTPGARIPRDALTRLWGEAVAATGDPCFGLVAARYALPTSFHALGYAVLASDSLREALERIIRYRRLIGDVVRLELQDRGDRSRFIIDVDATPGAVPFEAVDAFALTVVRQARLLRGQPRSSPLAVSLRRPEPAGSERFRDSFRAPVAFAQPANFLEFAGADLDAALPTGNAELARQNDEAVVRYLARLEQSGVAVRVQHALLEELPNGAPSKTALARRLGMSARTLQRHLDSEQTSFKELLNAARLALARDYLEAGQLPLTEIAFMLGFADSSAFSRAFKRWTGTAPRDYARSARRGEGRGARGGGRPGVYLRDRRRTATRRRRR
jgi:AraC-like DNA-binding protein